MATVYEIIQGLSQAAANAYDGALDESGEPIKAGLQREEGDPILDKRIMDGFGVKFYGNMMCLSYMSEVQLKKEYRKVQGESVTLTKEGEIDVRVENSSRVRSWVTAKMHYKIGGLDESMEVNAGSDSRPEAQWETFMSQGGWTGDGGKRPSNDTRPKPKND